MSGKILREIEVTQPGSDHRYSLQIVSAIIIASTLLVTVTDSGFADDVASSGRTAQSRQGMVVSVSKPASEIGRVILSEGGNAVDAAVAVAFALEVTWPEAGNIGGGGFMLIHPGGEKPPVFIDYRERAPAAARVDMFVNGTGSPYRLVGVPGTVRGLELAHKKLGTLPWRSLVLPAVRLAEDGFAISGPLAQSLNAVLETSPDNLELRRVYGKADGKQAWQAGDRLIQADLARTLLLIADDPNAFYTGPLAIALEAEMHRHAGLITQADLASYQARERIPTHGTYRGCDIYASAPPSSGGTALIEMLNIVETCNLRQEDRWSPRTLHLMIESMRRAYCDRARHLGDPDFNTIPSRLTAKTYAADLAGAILPTTASRSSDIGADILIPAEKPNTTHFSVVDRNGMAVSNTYTLEDSWGSRIVVRGAGYVLNNEMGDFNPQPGVTNSRGLIGTPPNLVAPGKRMLSSMTPVIVTRGGKPILISGSPGGRTIINTMFNLLVNVLEYEMSPREAVDAPRLHHAWMPDTVSIEPALLQRHESTITRLREMGHTINPKPVRQGDAHTIFIDATTGMRLGVADQRRDGWAAGE